MTNRQLPVHCGKCGGDVFEIPETPKPDDLIVCTECGAKTKYLNIEHATLTSGMRAVKALVRRGLHT